MYTDTIAKVITDRLTEIFKIPAGVLQGDTLAPYLFIIVIDYIMSLVTDNANHGFTITPARSRRYPAEKVTDAHFVDDIALLSNTIDEAQQMLASLKKAVGSVELIMD